MKGFKLLASCAVIGALSAVCAASSMAADYSATATYDAKAGTVSVTASQDYIDLVGAGDFTLLVLSEDATEITNENSYIVKQIQQGDEATVSNVKVGDLEDGTYYVRLGGADVSAENEKGFVATTFTVGGEAPQVFIGDVDGDKDITAVDCSETAKSVIHMSSAADNSDVNYYAAAYADGDSEITAVDCSEIAKYVVHMDTTYVGTTVDAGTYGEKAN